MSDERKDLPGVNASNFNERVREALQTYLGTRGDVQDRGLTLRDLKDAGLIALRPGLGIGGTSGGTSRPVAGPGPAVVYAVDLSPPPAPEGLAAKTSGKSIQVTINPQTYTQGHGPGKVIVFGAKYLAADPLPTYSGSAVLAEFTGDVFAFPVDNGSLYRIWAKSVSVDGVESSIAGGINGVEPVAGLLEDVSIANLTASMIRSGSITVGQFIQSSNFLSGSNGWRINGDGVAEFSGVIVRGAVYAAEGRIGGSSITADAISSAGYDGITGWTINKNGTAYFGSVTLRGSIAGGAFTGFAYPASGQTGFYLGSEGLLLGNANDGKFITIRANGNFESPKMSIIDGTLTISQINVIDTSNIKSNAATIMVSSPSPTGTATVSLRLLFEATVQLIGQSAIPSTGQIELKYRPSGTTTYLSAGYGAETVQGGTTGVLCAKLSLAAGDYDFAYVTGGVRSTIIALATLK